MTAVRASSGVPGLFAPTWHQDRWLIDGGVVNPVPVSLCRALGADIVIAVDISSPPDGNLAGGTLDVLLQTFSIMGMSINTFELQDADVVVRSSLNGIASSDFSSRKRSIDAGRKAMIQAMPQLRAAIAAKTRQIAAAN